MNGKFIKTLAFLIVFAAGAGVGIYARNKTLDPRASFPKIVSGISSTLIQEGEKEEDDLLYYDVDLTKFITQGSQKTKVTVEGVVNKIAKQPDGDYHVVLQDQSGKLFLVTEFIPEIKLSLPKAGDSVRLWGIVRLDILHNWWEIHPVIGWEKK